MRVFHRRGIAAALALAIAASAVAASAITSGAATTGTISGTVRLLGTPPKPAQLEISKDRDICGTHPMYDQSLIVEPDGGVANAVVTVPIAAGAPLKPEKDVKFDQKNCEYVPHVAVFPAGSTVDVINSDGILHNIHTESTKNIVLDMAQPGFKKIIEVKVAKPEAIKVTCDAHNWMEGWWYVTGTPYFALSDAHGHYMISGVPPGTYRVKVWQERLGNAEREIIVKSGAATIVDFALALPH